jgi:hypothetical protein
MTVDWNNRRITVFSQTPDSGIRERIFPLDGNDLAGM